jgi:hypothetical protein
METFLLTFSIICVTLGLLLLFLVPNSDLKVKDLKIPKRKFVLLVLKWCAANLGRNSYPFNLQIYYHRHLKWGGRYQHWNQQIVIYVYDDLLLEDLVETTVHEYVHHLQFSKKNAEQDYNKNYKEKGYWNNSYEIQARGQANKFKDSCYQWVLKEIEKSVKQKGR